MNKIESNFSFKLMTCIFKLRDFYRPRLEILKEVEIKQGDYVLDYGCGPGSYIIPIAELVGKSGKVYALDSHPLAIQMVQKIASKRQLTNVKAIYSNCKTGLPDNSVDVVLLYDVLHDLSKPDEILEELRRVLKPKGTLSVSDHHMKENEIISNIANRGLFSLAKRGKRTLSFMSKGK